MEQEQELVISQRLRAKIKKEILGDVLKELNLDEKLSGLSTKAKQERAKLAERLTQVEKSLKNSKVPAHKHSDLEGDIGQLWGHIKTIRPAVVKMAKIAHSHD